MKIKNCAIKIIMVNEPNQKFNNQFVNICIIMIFTNFNKCIGM